MKRRFSHITSIMFISLILCCFATQAHAYISEIRVFTSSAFTSRGANDDAYEEQKRLGRGWSYNSQDLNDGASGDYVFLFYKITDDPRGAITDIIMVNNGSKSDYAGDNNKTIVMDGRTYRAASYSENAHGGNLNRGVSDAPNLYLYYTKDGNANQQYNIVSGKSVIMTVTPAIQEKREEDAKDSYIKQYTPSDSTLSPNADMNAGAGGNYVYLAITTHMHKPLFSPDASGLKICDCGLAFDTFDEPEKKEGVYQISNLSDLCWWRDHVNSLPETSSSKACLTADIDMTPIKNLRDGNWQPIGCNTDESITHREISFDGNFHTISNMTAHAGYGRYNMIGLFGMVSGTFSNLNLKNIDVSVKENPSLKNYNIAGLIAIASGNVSITNCTISGKINTTDCAAAGFVNVYDKEYKTTIDRCTSKVAFWTDGTENCFTSGFVGRAVTNPFNAPIENVQISRCANYSSESQVAFAFEPIGSITNCINAKECPFVMKYDGEDKLTLYNNINLSNKYDATDEGGLYLPEKNYYIGDEFSDVMLTNDMLKSGAACWIMNDESADIDQVTWHQQLGTDQLPSPLPSDYIVYNYYTRYCGDTIGYTNNKIYAEDRTNAGHHWDYIPGEVTAEGLSVTKKCVICSKEIRVNAPEESRRVVKHATCMDEGTELVTYLIAGDNKRLYVEQPIASAGWGAELHHPDEYTSEDGNYSYCRRCGAAGEFKQPKFENNAYYITNAYEMMWLSLYCANIQEKTFDIRICNDIDMSEAQKVSPTPWIPIGGTTSGAWGKKGNDKKVSFVGSYHTIKGLYMNSESGSGLFGDVENAYIYDITVEAIVNGENGVAICKKAEDSKFEEVNIRGDVNSSSTAAGLCLDATNTVFRQCNNFAKIYGANGHVGGLVADANDCIFNKSTNQGDVDGCHSSHVGGIVADYSGYISLKHCGNYSHVWGSTDVGGIVGRLHANTITAVPGNSDDMDEMDIPFNSNLNVGAVTIMADSNSKGAFVGAISLANEDDMINLNGFYYKGAQTDVGVAESGKIFDGGSVKTDDAQLASGDVCFKLNGKSTSTNSVWHQNVGTDLYPYPYGESLVYAVNANNETLYITPNQVLDAFELHPVNGTEYYFHTDVPFTVRDMKYVRSATVKHDFYATVYLPFSFSDSRLKIMKYDHLDKQTGLVYFSEIETEATEPNTPYLVRIADDCDEEEVTVELAATDVQIVPEKSYTPDISNEDDVRNLSTGYYGTYKPAYLYWDDRFYVFSSKYGDFRKVNSSSDGTFISPFRCTFKLGADDVSFANARLGFASTDEDAATGISTSRIVECDDCSPVYNLNGQCVSNSLEGLQPGIYIRGGKKIYVNLP